jgi:molybdate transport system substrate-binding protein
MEMKRAFTLLAAFLFSVLPGRGADIRVLSSGAMKEAVVALTPEFERRTGDHVIVDSDTAGALTKRIQSGEPFDVVLVTTADIQELVKAQKVAADTTTPIATVGIGVCVKEGAPKPNISTVDAFRRSLLAAKSVAYIDPASGASSGIYVDRLLQRLGIADEVRAKAVLQKGGRAADLVASGKAEIGIQQISEIVPAPGVTLVGPLPESIQNVTSYSAGISKSSGHVDAAKTFVSVLRDSAAIKVLRDQGMTPTK